MEERRQSKRKFIIFYTRVFNAKTMSLVGHLGDITPTGAMVISQNPFPIDMHYRFKVELSEDISDKDYLELKALSLWSEKDVDPNLYNTGFSLLDISTQDHAVITRILDVYGIRDT